MSTKANPNKIVYQEHVDAPGQVLTFEGQQVEFVRGVRAAAIVVTHGSLRLSDELQVAQVVSAVPINGKGEPDNGLYLSGATGSLGVIQTIGCQRDHGKIGQGTHDLGIGHWLGGSLPHPPVAEGEDPVHRDGLQIMSAERVTIGRMTLVNRYPGATNGGLWLNPNKQDSSGVDANDPTLIQDVVVEAGVIVFPNAGIHLGACTRCGARNTTLMAQRPMRVDSKAVDPIDEGNDKIVLDV